MRTLQELQYGDGGEDGGHFFGSHRVAWPAERHQHLRLHPQQARGGCDTTHGGHDA